MRRADGVNEAWEAGLGIRIAHIEKLWNIERFINMEIKRCAIYIDLENIALMKNEPEIDIPVLMESVKRSISQKFSAEPLFILNIAAGNSSSIHPFIDPLIKYNFDIRTVKKISTIPQKSANRADLILSLEAFETLLMPICTVEVYVFVTRDSDFSVIMGKLRKYGKSVLLVTDSVSAGLAIFKNTTDIMLTFDALTETKAPAHIDALTETKAPAHIDALTETKAPDHIDKLTETKAPAHMPDAVAPLLDNVKPALKELVNILIPNEWTLYTSVAEKIPYKKEYARFSKVVAEGKEKGFFETRELNKGVCELRRIQQKGSKTETNDSTAHDTAVSKDIAGVKIDGKIISTGKQYARIHRHDRIYPDGIYKAYPHNFIDKTLAIEHLSVGSQVNFTIQSPADNKHDEIADNVVVL
jgi:hypothetical protein